MKSSDRAKIWRQDGRWSWTVPLPWGTVMSSAATWRQAYDQVRVTVKHAAARMVPS